MSWKHHVDWLETKMAQFLPHCRMYTVQSTLYTSSLICRRKRKLRKRQPSDYKNHYPPYHSWIKKRHRAEGKRKNFNEEVIKTRGKRNIIKHRHVQISLKSFSHNSNACMCTCIIILTTQLTTEFTVWRYCYTCISRGKTFFFSFSLQEF